MLNAMRLFGDGIEEALPCGDHRMNHVFHGMFIKDELLAKKNAGKFKFYRRFQKEDNINSSEMKEIEEEEYDRLTELNEVRNYCKIKL